MHASKKLLLTYIHQLGTSVQAALGTCSRRTTFQPPTMGTVVEQVDRDMDMIFGGQSGQFGGQSGQGTVVIEQAAHEAAVQAAVAAAVSGRRPF